MALSAGRGAKKETAKERGLNFSLEYLSVVTGSCSRNNNLYPDCLSNLEVGGMKWNRERRNGDGEGEQICMYLTFSLWLNHLISDSHLEFHRRLSLFHTLKEGSRGQEGFYAKRRLTAIWRSRNPSYECLLMQLHLGDCWKALWNLPLHRFMACEIQTFRVDFWETTMWYLLY